MKSPQRCGDGVAVDCKGSINYDGSGIFLQTQYIKNSFCTLGERRGSCAEI